MKLQPAWTHDNSDADVRAIPAVIDSLELANISKAIALFINPVVRVASCISLNLWH